MFKNHKLSFTIQQLTACAQLATKLQFPVDEQELTIDFVRNVLSLILNT